VQWAQETVCAEAKRADYFLRCIIFLISSSPPSSAIA
jgi:hypothetical protein